MKVSFITTVFNEEKSIGGFLESVLSQTQKPDEIIVVDGKSRDRTAEIVQKLIDEGRPIRLICVPCSVAEGRNIAIEEAQYDVIAVSDAGCELEPDWLEEILKPLENPDVGVSAGFYFPLHSNYFTKICSRILFMREDKLDSDNFSPSSRSIAFRKSCWKAAGGYPKTRFYGEDSYFNQEMRKSGCRFQFAPKAKVAWPLRPTVRLFARQFFLYAFGDGILRSRRKESAVRTGVHLLIYICLLLGFAEPWFFAFSAAFAGAYYIGLLVRRLRNSRMIRVIDYPTAVFILIVREHAQLLGYLSGLVKSGD